MSFYVPTHQLAAMSLHSPAAGDAPHMALFDTGTYPFQSGYLMPHDFYGLNTPPPPPTPTILPSMPSISPYPLQEQFPFVSAGTGAPEPFNFVSAGTAPPTYEGLFGVPDCSANWTPRKAFTPVTASLVPQLIKHPGELYSRKVFVGGLPIDITEDEVARVFSVFGTVVIDWPRRSEIHKEDARSMSGYVFLIYEKEEAVAHLLAKCHHDDDKFYLCVTSRTMKNKPVQVRPWLLSDTDYMLDGGMIIDGRRTVFIGGVPRPTKAKDLADALNLLYGPVAYVGIDIDPELKYPKGAARVTFSTAHSYVSAISGRFVYVQHADNDKRVEIKPYIMEEQMCDECQGKHCMGRYAPYFCGDPSCLQYYCEHCWDQMHYFLSNKFAHHCPMVRHGDQTKVLNFPPHHNNRGRGSRHSHHQNRSSFVAPCV